MMLLALVFLTGVASATEIYVGNQPYKGQVYRLGDDLMFNLPELSLALDIEVQRRDGVWLFGGVQVPTLNDSGKVWVKLKDLPPTLVRVVENAELRTLDLFRLENFETSLDAGDWTSSNTLVYFYATWSPACQNMAASMAELAGSHSIRVVAIDIDNYRSQKFKKYTRYFSGDRIPYFAVLSENGKKIYDFAGFRTYPGLLKEIEDYR